MTASSERAARALALFDELVEGDVAARATRVAALRNEDAALAAEVERLLAADASSGVIDAGLGALSPSVAELQGQASEGNLPSNAGRHIGPFALSRLLGRGGMGEVWLAQRSEGDFRQQVALKLLKRGMDSEDILQRFVQERRILADLSHPSIARFIDGGVGDDGAPWYAMEYVDGVAITECARMRALDVRARVGLIAQVAEAVAYAQTRLVVHRDLKPSNILVDAEGRVHLLDFGIAKLLAVSTDARQTATGVRAMSPAYAAPEQILDEPISTATDVYALGVVLYELLTGMLPHQRTGSSLDTLAESVRREAVEKPSAQLRAASAASTTTLGTATGSLQRFAREVSGELDTIVLTALRREPERRYASAAALADDLRRWLDGRPVAAQPDTASYRMRKFVARHRLAVGSASAVLLALVAGFGTALWQASVAREQARIAQDQTQRAVRVKEFLVAMFAETEGMGRSTGKQRAPLDMVNDGIASAERDLRTDPELRDSVLGDLFEIQVNLGAAAAAIEPLDRLIENRRAQFGADHPLLADAVVIKITALFQLGKFPDSEPLIDQAMTIYNKVRGPDHMDVADMQNRLVRVRLSQGRTDEALLLMREVLRKTEANLGSSHMQFAMRLSNLASVLTRMRQYPEAQAALQRSLAILESARGATHATLAFPLTTLGDLQRENGENVAALANYQRSAEILLQAMGPEHPRYAVALNRVGDMQRRQRKFADAAATLQRAREIQERGAFAELGDTYVRLGDLAADSGRADSAESWYRKAYQTQLATSGAHSSLTWLRLGLVSNAQVDQGRYDEARNVRREVTQQLSALGAGSAYDAAMSRFVAGVLERNAGNLDLAAELQSAAYAELQSLNARSDRHSASVQLHLALTLALRGRPDDDGRIQALIDAIGTLASGAAAESEAMLLLLRALRAPSRADRDRYLRAMDPALAAIGSGGEWLRQQRVKLAHREETR